MSRRSVAEKREQYYIQLASKYLMIIFNNNKFNGFRYCSVVKKFVQRDFFQKLPRKCIYIALQELVAQGKIDKINNYYGLNIKDLPQVGSPYDNLVFDAFQKFEGKAINLTTLCGFIKSNYSFCPINRICFSRKVLQRRGLITKFGREHFGIPDKNGKIEVIKNGKTKGRKKKPKLPNQTTTETVRLHVG